MSRKNSMIKSGWKLSEAASGRYFMDFKQKIMTKTEQNAFIESMNLGKQQNLFFMERSWRIGSDIGRPYWLDCSYLFVCVSAYL